MATSEVLDGDFDSILSVLEQYFRGLHMGDADKLKAIFHEDTWLKAPGVRRSLSMWLDDVKNRQKPAEIDSPFRFKVLSIDIVKEQAMAKVYCPLFEFHYIDFIGLLKEQEQWKIVNKMYVDTKQAF